MNHFCYKQDATRVALPHMLTKFWQDDCTHCEVDLVALHPGTRFSEVLITCCKRTAVYANPICSQLDQLLLKCQEMEASWDVADAHDRGSIGPVDNSSRRLLRSQPSHSDAGETGNLMQQKGGALHIVPPGSRIFVSRVGRPHCN
eukprot:6456084-Amphidinium_carterae.1